MKEVLWYKVASPMLRQSFSHVADFTPICFHAYSNYEDCYEPTACERHCCLLCYAPVRKGTPLDLRIKLRLTDSCAL